MGYTDYYSFDDFLEYCSHCKHEDVNSSNYPCNKCILNGFSMCDPVEECEVDKMTGNEYQRLAARTINNDLFYIEKRNHALFGMASEVGELHGIHQKKYQGHEFDPEHAKKEVGDLLWFVAEYCTIHDWNLEDIMRMNIEKLRSRYPEGFDAERSLHREEGDI